MHYCTNVRLRLAKDDYGTAMRLRYCHSTISPVRAGSFSLSSRVVDRVWSMRRDAIGPGMGYADFVTFLLAEARPYLGQRVHTPPVFH